MEKCETNSKTGEKLDPNSGPRVEKDSQNMTPENVLDAMAHSSRQMNKALQQAWDTRPENEPELEDQLLSILAASQKLEREIKGIIERQNQENSLE